MMTVLNSQGQRLTVVEAATMLGITEQMLRVSMAQGLIDIGYVYGSGRRKTYVIFSEKVARLKGKSYGQKD